MMLDIFNKAPSREHASSLVEIPTLHAVLAHEYSTNDTLSKSIRDVCVWLYKRSMEVLKRLFNQSSELDTPFNRELGNNDWKSVSMQHSEDC